jgi:hypothetical protein
MQERMTSAVFKKIGRRSKVISKQVRILNWSLRRRQIDLDEENFDILLLMQRNISSKLNTVQTPTDHHLSLQLLPNDEIVSQRGKKEEKDEIDDK